MMMMRYGGLKKGLALASLLTILLAQAAAGQGRAGGVTKEEEAAARAAAAAFGERLLATHDFAAVVRELYAEDFMSRYLAGESGQGARAGSSKFMLAGVPSLTFKRSLAAEAGVADWTRLRVAADNMLHFIWLSLLSGQSLEELGDPEKFGEGAVLRVFPPEAVKALDANPAASNLLLRKRDEVVVGTPEELRALAATLEEAVRLTRPRFAELLAKGEHLDSNLRLLKEASARDHVEPADEGAEALGYPNGTRLIRVHAPNGYVLLLVKSGGALKIVWAGLPSE